MRKRIMHGQKWNSLKTTQSISLNKNRKEIPTSRESSSRGHRPILFRNMAITKRFITLDYSNYQHQSQHYRTTRQDEECQIKEGRQPKRSEHLKLLNSLSSHIKDHSTQKIEAKPVYPMSIINATIQGKYIGLSTYKHRKSLREQQQSQLILKKLKSCSKQARRSNSKESQVYIGGISCKSIIPHQHNLKIQRKKEQCCKKSLSQYIDPIAVSSRVEKRQQQVKRQKRRVRCKTTNSLKLDVDGEAIDINKM